MNYLFILFIIFVIFILFLVFSNKKENFSTDIKLQGQTLINDSKQSLTGFYKTLKEIPLIQNPLFKDSLTSKMNNLPQVKNLEDNVIITTKTLDCNDGNYMKPGIEINGLCSICEPTYYCQNAQRRICPTGMWSNAGASTCLNLDKCPVRMMCTNKTQENCPTGYFCNIGAPYICPTGSYCSSGQNNICPTGTFNEFQGKFLPTDCLKCPITYYCSNGNKYICPTGSYCADGNRNICPKGSYNPKIGSVNSTDCIICPTGSFCVDGMMAKCGPATWSDAGFSFCKYRDSVPPGYHYDESYFGNYMNDKNHYKIPCDPGYYCMTGFNLPCPSNTWSDALQSSCNPMSSCPMGYACGTKKKVMCSTGTTWSDQGAANCSPISECPEGSMCGNLIKKSCSTGTWSDKGAANCSPVSECPAGSACGSGKRVFCGTGTWSDKGASVCSSNSTCPGGYYISYNNSTGTYTGGIKVLCPEGSSCINGSIAGCRNGYYSMAGSSICSICEPGYGCKNGIRTMCGTGTFADVSGLTECKYCPIMARTTDSEGVNIIRNYNVKTLDSSGREVSQGATKCKLADKKQQCSTTNQCGKNSSGKQLCCAEWTGSGGGDWCVDPDSWIDWAWNIGGYYRDCMTGPVSEVKPPYIAPGEYNYTYSSIGPN